MISLLDIFPIALLILCILNVHLLKPANEINDEYLSHGTTKYYRGLFALVVVFHHLSQNTASGFIFRFFSSAGYLAVAVFFFFSGYGLQKSYMTKKDSYKKGFLLKRIPRVAFPYIICIIIYWIVASLSGTVYSLADVFGSLINGYPIVTYSWYIISIVVFYLFYWLFMLVCNKFYNRIILYGCIWYVLWSLLCIKMNYGTWWFNASHLLIVGIVWATYEERITKFIGQYYSIIAPIMLISFVVLFLWHNKIISLLPFRYSSLLLTLLTAVIFVLCVILLSMKVKIGNHILGFLGEISLEIYLVQGLFIKHIPIWNEFVWCIVVTVLSVSLAFVLHKFFTAVLSRFRLFLGK